MSSVVENERPRILILADYFLPGEKAGGPVRTIAATVAQLGDQFDFDIATRDRDLGDDSSYLGIPTDTWIEQRYGRTRYLPPKSLAPGALGRLLRSSHDVLYIHSLFSLPFAFWPLLLRRLHLVPETPVVLAPHGQLDPGALSLGRSKKVVFLLVTRMLQAYHRVHWQATNPEEAAQIKKWFGSRANITLAPDLRHLEKVPPRSRRRDSEIRVVFVSRISRKKNLAGALEILQRVRARVRFDIFGPPEDDGYWQRCQELIRALPSNVTASYGGVLPFDQVQAVLHKADVLLLPTLGENFGHVIIEALSAGCAPLISDRTPWRELAEKGIGWDIPLENLDAFRLTIDEYAQETPERRFRRAERAMQWARTESAHSEARARNAALLWGATQRYTSPIPPPDDSVERLR